MLRDLVAPFRGQYPVLVRAMLQPYPQAKAIPWFELLQPAPFTLKGHVEQLFREGHDWDVRSFALYSLHGSLPVGPPL